MSNIIVADARSGLARLPADHFHAVVTSPPYWGLRKYAAPKARWGSWVGQLGAEPTPELYIEHLVEVCRHIYRVLRPDGVFWLNLGDSYAADKRGNNRPTGSNSGVSAKRQSAPAVQDAGVSFSVPQKSALMIPHRVALALQADGWIVRACLPWLKRNGMPSSVGDRPTVGVEYVFMLTREPRYFYDACAVRYPPAGHDGDRGLRCGDIMFSQLDAIAKGLVSGADGEPLALDVTTRGFKGAHFACVDLETEALTRKGWRRQEDLCDGEEIAAFDPHHGIVWQPATFHRYTCSSDLISIEKRDTSQLLTTNHRCLVRRRTKRGYKYDVVTADCLTSRMDLVISSKWGCRGSRTVGLPMAELMGWYVAEGSAPRYRQVHIYQSLSANPEKVTRIRKLLKQVGADFNEHVRTRPYKNRTSVEVTFSVSGRIASKLVRLCPDKKVPVWAHRLRRNEACAMLRGLIDGDGHRRQDGRASVVQKDRDSADRIQILALRCGFRAHVHRHKNSKCHTVFLTRGRLLTLRGTNGRKFQISRKPYQGVVWCPAVPSGFWLARRNGMPFITGNTFPEALVEPLLRVSTSEMGCCAACGTLYKRVVEKVRTATRPARDTKVAGRAPEEIGNRDPERHVTSCATTGWKLPCGHAQLPAPDFIGDDPAQMTIGTMSPTPCRVLDPFLGSGTTGVVAAALGLDFTGVEVSPEYARMAQARIDAAVAS